MSQAEAATERTQRPSGILVRVGRHKWMVPTATVLSSIGLALLASYQYLRSERDALAAEDARLAAELVKVQSSLALEQVVLAQINAQLARIDARVAEIQVTLMRDGRRQ
jgi:hypothetical protein